jgi:hypothetical protein
MRARVVQCTDTLLRTKHCHTSSTSPLSSKFIFFSLLLYHNVIGIRIRVSEQALNACSGP